MNDLSFAKSIAKIDLTDSTINEIDSSNLCYSCSVTVDDVVTILFKNFYLIDKQLTYKIFRIISNRKTKRICHICLQSNQGKHYTKNANFF